MLIRKAAAFERNEIFRLWNESADSGEVVYKPLNPDSYKKLFLDNPHYDGAYDFVSEEDGKIIGFISGAEKKIFLPGETHENTPGYITAIFVDKAFRGRGIGKALLNALEDAFRKNGKKSVMSSGNNPINLPWYIPETPGHDHNNAPGTDVMSMGYEFLLKNGYKDLHREVAMYLELSKYEKAPEIEEIRSRLKSEGITAGRYDCALNCEFDGMCDRVGSEYWRKVLKDETTCENPRVILAGVTNGHIVGFTGPVDLEPSGRGWFTGICVDPLFEKRGIATVIFNDLMHEFILEGAKFSTLFTGVDNHAQKLYKRTGFNVKRTFAIMKKEI
ncbi:MAG: GNAT family N-acetyltransferase [Clostridia bacterium]|nr:GNAT family N-acetyltransferase [Clostridia bacterium]